MRKQRIGFLLAVVMVFWLCGNAWAADQTFVWEREANLPASLMTPGCVVVGTDIYILGGQTRNSRGTLDIQDKTYIFNTISGSWSNGPSLPRALSAPGAAYIDGKIYVVAGSWRDSGWKSSTNVYIYDLATGVWTSGSGIKPTATYWPGTVAVGSKIYCFGGTNNAGTPVNSLDVYDILTDQWETYTMPMVRRHLTPIAYGDKIYLIGGHDVASWALAVDIYDTSTGTWSTGDNIPSGRMTSAVNIIGENIYLFGGMDSSDLPSIDEILVYNIPNDTWKVSDSTLTSPRQNSATAIVGDKIYIIGGGDSQTVNVNTVESSLINTEELFVLLDPGELCQLSLTHDYIIVNPQYNWRSTNTAVAIVDGDGLVTAVAEGEAYIYCESTDGTYSDYIPVKVKEGNSEIRLAVHLENAGDRKRLWLTDDPAAVITWSSHDPGVATVDGNGVVTAASRGLALIEAEKDGNQYYIYARVNN